MLCCIFNNGDGAVMSAPSIMYVSALEGQLLSSDLPVIRRWLEQM